MKKPKILLLGSYARSLINFRGPLIGAMIAKGWHVTAAAPNIDPATFSRLRTLGAEPVETPLSRAGVNPFADLAYYLAIRKVMRAVRPDVLLAYTAKPVIWGCLAAAAVAVPRIIGMITGLGYAFAELSHTSPKRLIVRAVVERLYRSALAGADCVLFQNPDDRDLFLARGLVADRDRVGLINGSGVDLSHFARAPLPGGASFLLIARLLAAKGVREYATAAIALKKRYPQATFRLVGWLDEGPDGITESELHGWTEQGLEYLGHLNDVRPAIAASSVYVLPSYYREGVPRSTLEALSMGRPVITTDAPGCRETVIDGVNGFLVSPRDSTALAAAMERFIIDPALAPAMGEASWQLACRRFDVRLVNEQILSIIAELGDNTDRHPLRHHEASV